MNKFDCWVNINIYDLVERFEMIKIDNGSEKGVKEVLHMPCGEKGKNEEVTK